MSLCTIDFHIKSQDIYCRDCKVTFCLKCISSHKAHDTLDIDDYYEEIKKNIESINSKFNEQLVEIENEKVSQSSHFQKEITKQYEGQLLLVDALFRELHDQLHIKQVDIKRELKSYYDENIEKYTMLISKLDHLKQLNNSIDLGNSDDHQHKISVITDHINSLKLNNNNNNDRIDSNEYRILSITDTVPTLDSITMIKCKEKIVNGPSINLNSIVVTSSNPERYKYLYTYNPRKSTLDKVDLDSTKIIESKVLGRKLGFMVQFQNWQSTPNSSNIYELTAYNGNLRYWNLIEDKEFTTPFKREIRSSISDAKGNIFFMSGPGGGTSYPEIHKLHLNNQMNVIGPCIFSTQVEDLRSNWQNLSWGPDGCLYIVGGNKPSIYKYNPETNKAELVASPVPLATVSSFALCHGCYSPKYHSVFFVSSQEPYFLSYDINSKTSTILEHRFVPQNSNLCKVLHDNDDNILCFETETTSLFKYNIVSKKWSSHRIDSKFKIEGDNLFVLSK
ncbi:hypothetical protein DLAC_06419 [Tieghemostelium lacteum]|uniref:B box-type domain-containing protein n=1 Tax=Tieghemostelium lacteum TaxID=361077 RepID=A0A151ZEU9_TIELA|nr:hypothetical protein DLAC_06419 [Tieghemostelium lacteum]|eukprot:KYQ92439.1 hypothetical protein DLAC_06419 [Tieghemostelium lacteum]